MGERGPLGRFLVGVLIVVGVIFVLDAIGLAVFLFSRGQLTLATFKEFLGIVLLLEGSVIGGAGGFLYLGYSEYQVARQDAINPAIIADHAQRFSERRMSQQKWGTIMLITGFLLILLFLALGLIPV